jgi:fatty acid synthase subunit alpha, fungi type
MLCAVNPSRVGRAFNGAALCEIANATSNDSGCLLEIRNFNVEVRQLFFMLHSY